MPGQTIGTVNVQVNSQKTSSVRSISYGARTLKSATDLSITGAADGDVVKHGSCLIAPGGAQLEVVRQGSQFVCRVFDGPQVNGHKPSVEVMMRSVAGKVAKP